MQIDGTAATLDEIKALALTNYGHFTSMLVESGRVRGLSLHMQRLARDCRLLFNTDLDTDQIRKYIRDSLDGPNSRTVVRVTVFDPDLDLGTIGTTATPRALITTRPASDRTPPSLRLQAASYQREMPAIKHIGLFGALQRRRAAQREGYDDVLLLNPDGTVSEIATSNIGFIRDGRVIWPQAAYLGGVTMTLLHQALDEPIATEILAPSDLHRMDAAFATNAATGIRPVLSVDDVTWPESEHPMLNELRSLYADIPSEVV